MAKEVVNLADLDAADVPERLTSRYYFDFEAHPFAHSALFDVDNAPSIIDAIAGIDDYIVSTIADTVGAGGAAESKTQDDFAGRCVGKFTVMLEKGAAFDPAFVVGGDDESNTIYVAAGAKVLGANIWLDKGGITVGAGTTVEPGVGLKGPTIIGQKNEIRQGAYFRGDVITGNGCTLRGELKNTVLMDTANFPHPSYLGDSLCGYGTHFGNQATSANLGIFAVIARDPIILELDGAHYNLGRPKVGIIMGDYSQVGCNSVSDPATFLAPWTVVYQLSRLNKGFYGPNELLKNKPIEHGIIERGPLRK